MIRLDDFLAANPDASTLGPVYARSFSGYCFDSRIVRPGQLFVAVRTARADGHDYVEAACRGGAAGAIVERPMALAELGATSLLVPDSEEAIQRYGAHMLRVIAPRIVAITGSAGKTTTKEAIAHVLAGAYRVFRNPGNYSGRFGLPIALGDLETFHEVAVLEMATDHFGEMELMTRIAPPEVAVVTLVAPAHLAAFGDLDGVAREKGVLVAAVPPSGLAILNADDPRVLAMADRARCSVTTYGLGAAADYRAEDVHLGPDGTRFRLVTPAGSVHVRMRWLGAHMARAAVAAAAVADHFGMPLDAVAERLATLEPVRGRLNLLPGRDGAVLVDDTYNASPEAVAAGMDVIAAFPNRTRCVVLGEMAELGERAEPEHLRVGRLASRVADVLVTRGKAGEWIAEGARREGMPPENIALTYTAGDAVAAVEPHLGPDTLVYVKGSAVARMEQVVAGLLEEPELAGDLLVRQNAAWRQLVVVRPDRPTWLEIDHGAIGHNVRRLVELADGAAVYAVLKADAYGHGAQQVAHTALLNGAAGLAVACLPEAAVLRHAGVDAPILVLGYTPAWQARAAASLDVKVTVYDEATARALDAAARGLDRTVRVHVKVDTGMHRLGLGPDEAARFLARLAGLDRLEVEGIFTHFAEADDLTGRGRAATRAQRERFDALLAELEGKGLRPPMAHAANSAALLTDPEARYDAVRPGIALYGLAPSGEVRPDWLRPALAWKTQIAQVRELQAGERVGYGGTWSPERPSRIATLPVGYADGFRRAPATWQHVLVRGQPAPVVGRVSMDQSTADVTDIPEARQGDEVVLIGAQGGARLSAETVADWLGTINYEVVSAILARVPRVS